MISVSIVIPTCNRPEALRQCLHGLAPQIQEHAGVRIEIIVSDDSATQSAQKALQGEFPHVRFSAGPARGPAANRNAGAALANGEIVVFFDDDCIPQPGALSAYIEAFRDETLMAAEGRISADRPPQRLDEESPINETGGWFWSCNIALRLSFFREIGGFDERFPAAAMEDVELRERIRRRRRVPIRFVPAAFVVHPQRRSAGIKHVRSRAKAHGIYRRIPGCHLPPPSWLTGLHKTLSSIIRFTQGSWLHRGRGSWQALPRILLPLWSTWEMKHAMKMAKLPKWPLS